MDFKAKLTRNQIKNLTPLLQVGSGVTHLLRGLEPLGYNSGFYGWNWDLYNVYDVFICAGCKNLCGEPGGAVVAEFEERAEKLTDAEELAALRKKFAEAVKKQFQN